MPAEVASLGADLAHARRKPTPMAIAARVEQALQLAIDAVVRAFEAVDAFAIRRRVDAVVAGLSWVGLVHRFSPTVRVRRPGA